ncbi:outer membrane protein assembly factor BamA [Pseudohalocynthiibacter aestuariivivens]|nr:outer membrane protein assembly factor BamA [Pseudohalocynthiibacter aestuariivivens]QIE44367.1 outer membrane protein assembly factor BamA [Pseudohalocynthiibacter aestuariivivens]
MKCTNDLRLGRKAISALTRTLSALLLIGLFSFSFSVIASPASAQSYRFSSVSIEGNQRIEAGTILTYAGIARGQSVSAGELNDAYQRILASGLFEEVVINPRGSTLEIRVKEYPTISKINFEGNKKIKDEDLIGFIESAPRQVFNPAKAERDAATIIEAYAETGRSAARVTPRVIRRSDNRVDLVFEIFEGRKIEVQRISIVGNRAYSDRRLRRVLQSKQTGIFRALVNRDTFVEDRIEFDKQVLADFYAARGYVDFRVTGVNAELARERDTYFVTFNVQEGQQFRFGQITTISEINGVEAEEYQAALKIKPGVVYSPSLVENSIARMERLGIRQGHDFLRVEPRISRNDRDLTLDVEFVILRGPRIFVERIDIEGNTTTLDRVIRRQFDTVEGDPFNPREIRETAERIRALDFFTSADVDAREGSRPDQVVVDVDVEEKSTGTLSFGASYSTSGGIGVQVGFSERNFLGRGQRLSASVAAAADNINYNIDFVEPAFLGRDVAFGLSFSLLETDGDYALYDTTIGNFRPSLTFPVSENGRLSLSYSAGYKEMDNYTGASAVLTAESAVGGLFSSGVGYNYTYDTRRTGLNPNAGVLLSFGQDFYGLGGDSEYIKSSARAIAQTKVLNEEVTLRATLEGGALHFSSGQNSRAVDRFSGQIMRGFEPNGIGPVQSGEQLGGNFYAALKLDAEFPLGLPDEYGITAGAFYDMGAIWDVNNVAGGTPISSQGFKPRHVVGVAVIWQSPFGPLRFNFSHALQKEASDKEQQFDLTIQSEF